MNRRDGEVSVLDRSQEKLTEKVRKLKQKGQYQKARAALDEAGAQAMENPVLAQESLSLSFQTDSWQDALKALRRHLDYHPLKDLIQGDNREPYFRLTNEYGGFLGGLTHMLVTAVNLENLEQWVALSENYEQRRLIRQWSQAAGEEEARDPARAALLRIAAGVGLFVMNDWDGAWSLWTQALKADNRQLKKLLTFCQKKGRLENTRLSHRLRMIRLISAAGKMNDSLTLLKAVGLESRENALKVLNELPSLFPEKINSKDVATLRFSLALTLEDPEILVAIINGMTELSENDLFRYKKLAMSKLSEPEIKRKVMLGFVKLYMEREEWEPAGHLLESIYMDTPHPETVTMMEQVLAHYPIMSQLHFTAGKHYLGTEDYEKAVFHLGSIQQVEEYKEEILKLLEASMAGFYEPTLAEMLLGMLPANSHKAGLLAFWILTNESEELEKHISLWAQPKFTEASSPFWYLALINGFCRLGRMDEAGRVLGRLLQNHPALSPEGLRCAEMIAAEREADFTTLTRAIEDNLDRLQPRNAWSSLRIRFIEATQKFKKPRNVPSFEQQRPSERAGPISDEIRDQMGRFRVMLDQGKLNDAAELAVRAAKESPRRANAVLQYLHALSKQFPFQTIWIRSMLMILNGMGQYDKAVQLGTASLAGPGNQAELPELYQLIAEAYQGAGGRVEAFRFLCLASRRPRFFARNAGMLVESVLPEFPQYLKDVVQLVLINEDQDHWEPLMKHWFDHRPEDIEQLLKAQRNFTQQVNTTQSILDLAFWALQAGHGEEVNQVLSRLDLSNPEIQESLTELAALTALKFPNDPKPKFLLGKFYLAQGEVAKAVDTFRELVKQVPSIAETIYHHLRTYLRQNPLAGDKVRLYGLLIRFALDHSTPLAAVRLLEEYARQDQDGAQGLADGVYRVILRRKNHLEAAYEFLALLHRWGDHERLLDHHEMGDFGTHMVPERSRWFEEIGKLRPDLKDRALLSRAQIQYETFEFDQCRNTLSQILNEDVRQKAVHLYEKLADRFPQDLDIQREAAWAAYGVDNDLAARLFERELANDSMEIRTEAFAVLTELGRRPDRALLVHSDEEKRDVFGALHQAYQRVNNADLELMLNAPDKPVPLKLLCWLVETGQWDRYGQLLPRLDESTPDARALVEAYALWIRGQRVQAAWRVCGTGQPAAVKQTYFMSAGMTQRAVLHGDGSSRLPRHIREAFLKSHRRPIMINASFDHIRLLQRQLSMGDSGDPTNLGEVN